MMMKQKQKGFTLIEVMITMVVALIVLAGMTSLFVSQTRTAQMLNQKSEVMNDLFLASQIMQAELRNAQAICWDGTSTNKRIGYQPLQSTDAIATDCSTNLPNGSNGAFELRPKGTKSSPWMCWNRPSLAGGCQELIRGMVATTGLAVSPAVSTDLYTTREVTLTATYKDRDLTEKNLSLTFKVWPRNAP